MKTIAENTTATKNVINKYNKQGFAVLYPCYEDDCDDVNMIYLDNGNKECYTLDKSKRNNDDNVIVLRGNEMMLRRGSVYLETLNIKNI